MVDASDALPADWFMADVVGVARGLVGRWLMVDVTTRALILETEAYGGAEDLASHAAFRPGGRAAVMTDHGGTVYVYAAYGMYPCFNIVTGARGSASAVLLRGVLLPDQQRHVSGPGRTARALDIVLADHGERIPGPRFSISTERVPCVIQQTTRVGIRRGVETPWRFAGRPLVRDH
ncbi:MAG TPA: DNA-3-methyladenine glycosylase [Thermomicrobiales bacterium]|nr:DNA-3-methyladenine glycosylase [Thermomicrobiales bacterium]HQZ88704.1 DNA-3-methyladenine glycosylase [Thermomicrobiales bacterium]HRA31754.1 DNA-3-methyladenine glycosylase [Thermomicrobiales bacterium]